MRIQCLLLLAVAGCYRSAVVAVNLVPTAEAPHALAARAPGDIKVVSTPPSEPFAEIGFIEGLPNRYTTYTGGAVTAQTVLTEMRQAAGRWGCDYLLISSSTVTRGSHDAEGHYGGIGYHGACLVLLDAAKSASLVTGSPVPLQMDGLNPPSPEPTPPSNAAAQIDHISGYPEGSTPPSPDSYRTLLFLSADGKVYQVKPESRAEALKAGWAPIGVE